MHHAYEGFPTNRSALSANAVCDMHVLAYYTVFILAVIFFSIALSLIHMSGVCPR